MLPRHYTVAGGAQLLRWFLIRHMQASENDQDLWQIMQLVLPEHIDKSMSMCVKQDAILPLSPIILLSSVASDGAAYS